MGTLPLGPDSTRSGSFRFVAGRPSSRPITAYTHEPVQTLVSSVESGSEAMNSCSRRLWISCLVPNPPGMRKASMAGRSAKL